MKAESGYPRADRANQLGKETIINNFSTTGVGMPRPARRLRTHARGREIQTIRHATQRAPGTHVCRIVDARSPDQAVSVSAQAP